MLLLSGSAKSSASAKTWMQFSLLPQISPLGLCFTVFIVYVYSLDCIQRPLHLDGPFFMAVLGFPDSL